MGQTPGIEQESMGQYGFSVLLCDDGTVQTCGYNNVGQLGNGTTSTTTTFATIAGLNNIQQVVQGGFHTLALKNDGTVWAWGYNAYGQIGNGTSGGFISTPVQVTGITNAIAVFAGGYHSMTLLADGTVMCWGSNTFGQLGNGTNSDSSVPVLVAGLNNVLQIAAGRSQCIVLLSDYTVKTWGRNEFGQLGNGTWTDSNVPVATLALSSVKYISATEGSCYAIKSDNSIWAWGYNIDGQLGLGYSGVNVNVPTQMIISSAATPVKIVGSLVSCLILFCNGDLMATGRNDNCQFGSDTPLNTNISTLIISASPWVDLKMGIFAYHVLAIASDGSVQAWGANLTGQLGIGITSTAECVPVFPDPVCAAAFSATDCCPAMPAINNLLPQYCLADV
ncbi:RCC1 repeat-containing protein, partial [Sphingobacteriales bacterium UPWRP_1]